MPLVFPSWSRRCLFCPRAASLAFAVILVARVAATAEPDESGYELSDPGLKLVRIDSDPTESFLSVRTDTAGRVFVGGREAIFVHDPGDDGRYTPRRELYRFPAHSWVYDMEVRGEDLYALTNTALYVLPGAVSRREGIQARRLIWGIPMGHIHQCLHGLAWGPDGDLYFSSGDPMPSYGDLERPDRWACWTYFSQPDGTRMPYRGVGGVLRCRPDGTRLQIVARGTRNSIGLAFDAEWNLFSNDNDHESTPSDYVPGRLLHVTPHAYFAWPRGWMLEKQPGRPDLLQTIVSDMGRAVPVGQAFYDDDYLPAKYRGNLLVARWGTRSVTRYKLQPHGATFRAQEETLLVGKDLARPVGVCVGRGGRIFVVVCYMAHNEASPTYKSDLLMITRADDPPEHPFEPYDATTAKTERLWSELADPSWSRRYRAFVELHRRSTTPQGGELLSEATQRLLAAAEPAAGTRTHAFPHLIWLAGASCSDAALALLQRLAAHEEAAVRRQAVRTLTEFFAVEGLRDLFASLLKDPDLPVRHAATLAFFRLPGPPPEALARESARSEDTYVRQAATLLLARKGTVERLESLCASTDEGTRMAGVLAAGIRLTLIPANEPLDPALPLAPYRGEGAYIIEYADRTVDLRDVSRAGTHTFAEHWNARARTKEEERLVTLLLGMLADRVEAVRLEAARSLAILQDPRCDPEVAKVKRRSEDRRLATARNSRITSVWAAGPFSDDTDGFATVHPPEIGAVDLETIYGGEGTGISWKRLEGRRYDLAEQIGSVTGSSSYVYFRLESAKRQRAVLRLGSDDGLKVWHNGTRVLAHEQRRSALAYQDNPILELEPGSNDILIRVQHASGGCRLRLHYAAIGNVVPTLPAKLGMRDLAERLRDGGTDFKVPTEFLDTDWNATLRDGDPEMGGKLFQAVGCAKCHAVQANAPTTGGPSLLGAAKRFTPSYLVDSVLFPSRQISPVFRGTALVLTDGQVVSGLVIGETAKHLEVLLTDATRRKIALEDVAERRELETSPMPHGLVKTPEELRDIIAYLLAQ